MQLALLSRIHWGDRSPTPAASDLLPLASLREDGLLARTDGALMRYVEVLPRNPLVMDEADAERMGHGFAALLARLPAGHALQVHVQATPVALPELVGEYRTSVEAAVGRPGAPERAAALRALADVHVESLEVHAAEDAAVRVRRIVVVPVESQTGGRWRRGLGGGVSAGRAGQERMSLALVDALRSEVEGLDMGVRVLDGPDVANLLYGRFAPALAAARPGASPSRRPAILSAEPEPNDDPTAERAAQRLRSAIAQADIDASDRRWLEVDGGLEQTIHLSGTPDATFFGWLLHAMQSPNPWTLSVHVRALDRALERRRYRQRHRRLYGVNRGAEGSGRVPDYDQRDHEAEVADIVAELTHTATSNVYDVAVYQTIRERGPNPDPQALAEAVEQAIGAIQHAADVRVGRGEFRQLDLWCSSLPLGLDVARANRRYATVNAADTLPLVGTSCGSPSGLHLGYADPGRTLLHPFDPLHDNGTLIVNGKSGGGKTFLVQALLSQALPLGARAAVIDRSAGHYRFLCDLIPGARHVAVAGEEGVTVNPWDVEDVLAVPGLKVAFLVRLHTLLIGDHHAAADAFGLSPLERNLLELAIRGVYQDAAKSGYVPCESYLREQLVQRAREEARAPEGSREVAATYRSLAERLHAFCGDGSYGALLDRPTTVDLADAPLVVFDTSTVPEEVSPALLFALSEHLAGHIERRREAHLQAGREGEQGMFAGRFVLVLEELWKLVERRATGAWINELARRARHLGLFLVCVTQQRSDLAGPWGKALLDNSTMQLFLRQSPDELAYLREALKLTDAEVAQIAHLNTDKRRSAQAYLINGTRGRGTVSVRLGPRAYWICTSDPIADVPERETALRGADEDAWTALDTLADRK